MEKKLDKVTCYCGHENTQGEGNSTLLCSECERLWGKIEDKWYLLIPNYPVRARTQSEVKNQVFLCKRCYGPTEFIGKKHRVRCLNQFCQYEWYEKSQGVSLYENQLKHRRQELQKNMIDLDSASKAYADALQELISIQQKMEEVKEEKL